MLKYLKYFILIFVLSYSILLIHQACIEIRVCYRVVGNEIEYGKNKNYQLDSIRSINRDSVLNDIIRSEDNDIKISIIYSPDFKVYKLNSFNVIVKYLSDATVFTSDEQVVKYKINIEVSSNINTDKTICIKLINERHIVIYQDKYSLVIITNELEMNRRLIEWAMYSIGTGHGGKWFLDEGKKFYKITIDSNLNQKKELIDRTHVKDIVNYLKIN